MKSIVPFLALLLGFSGNCQKRDARYQMDYEMLLSKPGNAIGVSVYKAPNERDKALVLMTSSWDCNGLRGVRIRLVNGDVLVFDSTPIECLAYAPDRPNVKASIIMDEELEQKLDGQEIAEFSLGYIKVPVTFKEKGENLKVLLKWVRDESGF